MTTTLHKTTPATAQQMPELAPNGEPKRDRFANSHRIWQAALELRNTNRRINRSALAGLTGLKPGIVDDHVDRFIERDQIRRAGNGELEVVEQFPAARPISKTTLPNGLVKLEVGSDMLELTPDEARAVARDFAGNLHELAETDAANKGVRIAAEVARELKEARKRIAALECKLGMDTRQLELV
jgi:hypothetical protein